MNQKNLDKKAKQKLKNITEEIVTVFEKHQVDASSACAVLGGILAHFAYHSDDNSPFLPFFCSFGHSFTAILELAEEEKLKDSQ
jgi:hypothetical protein